MNDKRPRHYTTTGRFNILSDEKQQQVFLVTAAGTVSQLWAEGEAPYEVDMLPSVVSQNMRERINSYLLMSDRKDKLDKLNAIDARADEFDRDFMLYRADAIESEARRLLEKACAFRREASMLDPPREEVEATMRDLGFPQLRAG